MAAKKPPHIENTQDTYYYNPPPSPHLQGCQRVTTNDKTRFLIITMGPRGSGKTALAEAAKKYANYITYPSSPKEEWSSLGHDQFVNEDTEYKNQFYKLIKKEREKSKDIDADFWDKLAQNDSFIKELEVLYKNTRNKLSDKSNASRARILSFMKLGTPGKRRLKQLQDSAIQKELDKRVINALDKQHKEAKNLMRSDEGTAATTLMQQKKGKTTSMTPYQTQLLTREIEERRESNTGEVARARENRNTGNIGTMSDLYSHLAESILRGDNITYEMTGTRFDTAKEIFKGLVDLTKMCKEFEYIVIGALNVISPKNNKNRIGNRTTGKELENFYKQMVKRDPTVVSTEAAADAIVELDPSSPPPTEPDIIAPQRPDNFDLIRIKNDQLKIYKNMEKLINICTSSLCPGIGIDLLLIFDQDRLEQDWEMDNTVATVAVLPLSKRIKDWWKVFIKKQGKDPVKILEEQETRGKSLLFDVIKKLDTVDVDKIAGQHKLKNRIDTDVYYSKLMNRLDTLKDDMLSRGVPPADVLGWYQPKVRKLELDNQARRALTDTKPQLRLKSPFLRRYGTLRAKKTSVGGKRKTRKKKYRRRKKTRRRRKRRKRRKRKKHTHKQRRKH